MNTTKITALGQNISNSSTLTKTVRNTQNAITFDDLANGYTAKQSTICLSNGKTVSNMLDAFIAATGSIVEEYNPGKVIDFLA